MTRLAPLTLALLPLAACAAVPPDGEEPMRRMPEGDCSADAANRFVGQRATAEVGSQLLQVTGARVLRWVPPRTAVTMDYRADRLTVSYGDDYVIERVSCG
jgi:hypothetical protein